MDDTIEIPRDWEQFGPKMRALPTDRQRAFVYCLVNNGGRATRAAAQAGYSTGGEYNAIGTAASRLMQQPDILDALEECTWRKLNGLAIAAVSGLEALIKNPQAKGHAKAVEMVLERTGFVAEKRLKIEDDRDEDGSKLAEKLLALCTKLQIDPAQLLGPLAKKLTAEKEAVVAEVEEHIVPTTPIPPKKRIKLQPRLAPLTQLPPEETGLEGLEDVL